MKYSKPTFLLLIATLFVMSMSGNTVLALTAEQKKLIDSGAGWTDPFGTGGPCSAQGGGGNRIYVVGDSLTVGMRDTGKLDEKLKTAGWDVKGIQATTGITTSASVAAIDPDTEKIKSSDVVVIMLGTNKDSNFSGAINEMITKIKAIAPAAQIHWMNSYTEAANYDAENRTLSSEALKLGFKVIDWKTQAQANPVKYPFAGDGIHHTAAGYTAKAEYLVTTLGTPKATGTNLSGGSNIEIAFNFLTSKGLSDEQAAGAVGNLSVESIGVNPTMQQIGGGPGRGIAQWEVGARWDILLQFASIQKLDPLSLETQLNYLWWEFTGEPEVNGMTGGNESAAYKDLLTQTTVAGAAASFMLKFERPQDKSPARQAERAAVAQPIYDEFAGGSGGGSSAGGGCAASNGATVSIDGFFFPLETTKTIIQAGGANASGEVLNWNPTCQENCHHDYNAADIHVAPGTKVVVAKPGTVVSTRDKIGGGGSHVVIMGDDNVLYYYTHMSYGSLAVADDQVVTGGQLLGEVGDSKQAMDTAAHLHFDALPGDQYKFRPGCSSEVCAGYPFINISPILSELYKELPE